MIDAFVFAGVMLVGIFGAVGFSRAWDRAFHLFGRYQSGPRAYPDQDPAPPGVYIRGRTT